MFRLTSSSMRQMTLSVKSTQLRPTRLYSQMMSDAERKIYNKLSKALEPVDLEVEDISGGCGSMYAINVTSDKFQGLSMIKQHKLVNSILAKEIAQWHGLQLSTRVQK